MLIDVMGSLKMTCFNKNTVTKVRALATVLAGRCIFTNILYRNEIGTSVYLNIFDWFMGPEITIIIIIIIINCKWVCTRWQWYYNTQYNTIHKITHTHSKQYTTKITNTVTQNYKHSAQNES
jgi:hypothetical protein